VSSASTYTLAAEVLDRLRGERATLAVAESLTGGLVGAALTSVPGASAVFRGGVLSYATDLKASLLGVDGELLAASGAVHPTVAVQMAAGVRRVCDTTYGVSTTGVAGPDPQDGAAVGTVHVAIAGPGGSSTVSSHVFPGDREAIRTATVAAVLRLLLRALSGAGAAPSGQESQG
jgi:PncC family amidohydrolase